MVEESYSVIFETSYEALLAPREMHSWSPINHISEGLFLYLLFSSRRLGLQVRYTTSGTHYLIAEEAIHCVCGIHIYGTSRSTLPLLKSRNAFLFVLGTSNRQVILRQYVRSTLGRTHVVIYCHERFNQRGSRS
jgi:hypothetical protein